MVNIIKNNNKIKISLDNEDHQNVKINDDFIPTDSVKYEIINRNGKTIRRFVTPYMSFSVIDDDVFGKTSDKARFSGKIGEDVETIYPDLNNNFEMGQIKMCGHE